ncbi:MAG TPA: MBL fold metallo-hydrolase, partial [Polyangiaceae bacterium]
MQITFWGVRGSIPTPGPDTVAIGGNTSCVELRAGKALLVFDGGTGLRLLGKKLLAEMPIKAHIFFSHVHWDHIQGFPFFDPAFVKGNEIHLYGGNNVTRTLEETLAGQMDHPSFPVHLADMAAKMTFADLDEGERLEIDDGMGGKAVVTTGRGRHPNGVWLYRVEHAGKKIVYATDTEHTSELDPNVLKIADGADVLVYDAQYTPEEYEGKAGKGGPKVGWGHSTFTAAA